MNIYHVIILDESGSMTAIYQQALTGINEVLSGIRKSQQEFPDQHHYVTIVTFEGNGMSGVKTRRDRVAVENIKDFTQKDYCPGGCTPLYDAMGKTLVELESQIGESDRVMATIITDGYENSSMEYSGKAVKNLVSRLREKGWTFAYIGANQDAVEVATDLNIDNALNFEATSSGTRNMCMRFCAAASKFSRRCNEEADNISMSDLFDKD